MKWAKVCLVWRRPRVGAEQSMPVRYPCRWGSEWVATRVTVNARSFNPQQWVIYMNRDNKVGYTVHVCTKISSICAVRLSCPRSTPQQYRRRGARWCQVASVQSISVVSIHMRKPRGGQEISSLVVLPHTLPAPISTCLPQGPFRC